MYYYTSISSITELFADKYEDLYSCVSYDEGETMTLRMEIDSMVNSDNLAHQSNISITDVLNAVSTLKHT